MGILNDALDREGVRDGQALRWPTRLGTPICCWEEELEDREMLAWHRGALTQVRASGRHHY